MTTIQMLEDAIDERIRKENQFKDLIVFHINEILRKLPMCDSTTSPHVSNTVTLSRQKLASILSKIGDYSSINENAAKELIQKLNLRDVRRGASNDFDADELIRYADAHPQVGSIPPLNRPGPPGESEEKEEFHFGGKRSRSRRR